MISYSGGSHLASSQIAVMCKQLNSIKQLFLLLLCLVTLVQLSDAANQSIELVPPTKPVMRYFEGDSVTLTWSFLTAVNVGLRNFACGYKNKKNVMVKLAEENAVTKKFMTSYEIQTLRDNVTFPNNDDRFLARRVINAYSKNENAAGNGFKHKRGFVIVGLTAKDAGKYVCKLSLAGQAVDEYGGEIELVLTTPKTTRSKMAQKFKGALSSTTIIIIASTVVGVLVCISVAVGVVIWRQKRQVTDYALGGQRGSFISCNSSDDEETEYQKD